MNRLFTAAAIAAFVIVPAHLHAQAGANPYTDAVKAQLAQVKAPIIRTAEKVPEDLYSFKPTPEVRSLGQLIGHIADANFNICGIWNVCPNVSGSACTPCVTAASSLT